MLDDCHEESCSVLITDDPTRHREEERGEEVRLEEKTGAERRDGEVRLEEKGGARGPD